MLEARDGEHWTRLPAITPDQLMSVFCDGRRHAAWAVGFIKGAILQYK